MVDHRMDIAAILAVSAARIGQQRMIALVAREHFPVQDAFDAVRYCDDFVRDRKGYSGQDDRLLEFTTCFAAPGPLI
jgi:hypothetical protein